MLRPLRTAAAVAMPVLLACAAAPSARGADLLSTVRSTHEITVGTASAACPDGRSVEARQLPTLVNAFADLSTGRLDAAAAAGSPSAYALKQSPALNFEIVADYKPLDRSGAGSAIGVAKGSDAFLEAYNKACGAMLADGTVAQIFTRWGMTPTDVFLA